MATKANLARWEDLHYPLSVRARRRLPSGPVGVGGDQGRPPRGRTAARSEGRDRAHARARRVEPVADCRAVRVPRRGAPAIACGGAARADRASHGAALMARRRPSDLFSFDSFDDEPAGGGA
jgi:hypothetical protein